MARFRSAVNAGPASHHEAVTPSDVTNLRELAVLYVGVTGNVVIITEAGELAKYTAVPAGTFIPLWAARVNATGTTASGIVAMW